MTTIDDSLKEGRLGPLSMGTGPDEVWSILGEPDARSADGRLWKYGTLQLAFGRDPMTGHMALTWIGIYFFKRDEHLPAALSLSGWVPNADTTADNFERQIKARGIEGEWSDLGPNASPRRQNMVFPSGVEVVFDEDGRVYACHLSARRSEPEGKQLSIFVPKQVLAIVGKEAAERKTSLSAVCAEWVKEHAKSIEPAIAD